METFLKKYALYTIVALVLLSTFTFSGKWDQFYNPQSYTSLLRAQQLHETGDWYNAKISRSNAPYGEKIAWTRPYDVLLVVPAAIGGVVVGFGKALSIWGMLIGPVLLIGTLVLIYLAARESWKWGVLSSLLAVILFFGLLPYFIAGRCEPRQLEIILFASLFYVLLRVLNSVIDKKLAYISGAIVALAMWVNVESLVVVLVVQVTFVALWFVGDLRIAKVAARHSRGLLVASTLAVLLERPKSEWMLVEVQKISAGHLMVFGIIAAIWSIMDTFVHAGRLQTPQERLRWSFRAFLIGIFILFLSFREFIWGAFPTYSPEAIKFWYARIAEQLPLIKAQKEAWIFILVLVITSLGYGIYKTIRSTIQERSRWVFLSSGMVIFTAFAFFKDRYWMMYVLIPTASILGYVVKEMLSSRRGRIVSYVIAFLVIFLSFAMPGTTHGDRVDVGGPSLKPLCEFLNARYPDGKPRRILAYIDYGPEILYRTKHEVIGIPFGNRKAIYDESSFMHAEDTDLSKLIVQERGIDTVIVTPESRDELLRFPEGTKFPSMHRNLITGKCPPWMSEVSLPEGVRGKYRFFEVSAATLRVTQEPILRNNP